ncbi:hypothetical protein [Dokdonella sp.]|uniref:hypothetical protein n=1 Tax=Dokdonella sp. TaxID=2291710 RepID=UPI001B0AB179|nr:hypothetical protein [Dokdonella sp.]MBO9662369.1 hypothetical protein [Dokdonella sp.]
MQLESSKASTTPQPPRIAVVGRALAGCAPQLDRAVLDGNDLSIALKKSPQNNCAKAWVPFYLRVDAAANAIAPLPPGQVYRIRVYSTDHGTTSLLAFALLDANTANAAPTPESGLWWSEASTDTGAASAGNGASIELQDGRLAVSLLGFGETGAATWYFGTAQPKGRVARVPLLQLANGDPPFAPLGNQPSAQPGPRIELEFLSPSRARAYLVRNDGGRDVEVRALTLSRSRFANGPVSANWTGQWVLVPDDGGAPRSFEFAAAGSQDSENFHLTDATGDARLDCRLENGTDHPDLCTLSAAAAVLADFDQVGLDHLAGRTSGGARVTLMRVPR